MNKEEIIKEKLRVNFNPRRFGKLQPLLLEFYGWCKKKKSAIFAMPEGNIYSQKAHDNILKAQREDILKKIRQIVIEDVPHKYQSRLLEII